MSDVSLEVNLVNEEITLIVEGPVTIVTNAGVQTFKYTQNTAADTWVVNHNLNRACNEATYNLAGQRVGCDVAKPSLNTVIFSFLTPQTGFAEIS